MIIVFISEKVENLFPLYLLFPVKGRHKCAVIVQSCIPMVQHLMCRQVFCMFGHIPFKSNFTHASCGEKKTTVLHF